jgi:uncharacterized protein (DUF427 family)
MESVHDFPRPPAVEPCARRARVEFGGVVVADSTRALRVLETTHPPAIYVPVEDLAMEHFEPATDSRQTFCEWKGNASYYDIRVDDRTVERAAWHYPDPVPAFAALRGHVAIYPGRVDACYLDDERVEAQPSDFYGGWITRDIRL